MSEEWNRAIEAVCRWHLDRAEECDSIAAVNRYNPLGPDAQTHANDHRLNADLIRAEFIRGSARNHPFPSRDEAMTQPFSDDRSDLDRLELRLRATGGENHDLRKEAATTIASLREELDKARELLKVCADSLADEVEANYPKASGDQPGRENYPVMQARYERDMAPVDVARAFLGDVNEQLTTEK